MPPPIAGWRRVTLQMAPFADSIQTVRGPCWEKAIIFDAMSSPTFTVITWGVKPTPAAPKASSCFFEELGGLPRAFLDGFSEDVPSTSPPPPESVFVGTTEEIGVTGVGERPKAMLPSGEYFLGRPLFFLAGSMLNPVVAALGDDASE